MIAYGGACSSSVRHLLRIETAADHAHVDARFSALLAEGTGGYGAFLRLSAAAIYPVEQALTAGDVERLLPDWKQRLRSDALRADLRDLGIEEPPLSQPPSLNGEAQQFGALYVLEGSRLGARLLVRQLRAAHPPLRRAMRYLEHGEGQSLWRSFLDRLESSIAVRRSPADAIAGARMAFACFGGDATSHAASTTAGIET